MLQNEGHKDTNLPFLLLKITVIALLLGRGYQHLFFELPYRAFFLDYQLFGWMIEGILGLNWADYTNSLKTDLNLKAFSKTLGIILWISAASAWFLPKKWPQPLLVLSSAIIAFAAICYFLDKGYQIGQGIEYTAQVVSPILLIGFANQLENRKLLFAIKVAIALTFLGHGLYAIGYYPVPGHFVQMVVVHINGTNAEAIWLLKIAGILDMVVVVGIFLPRVAMLALIYAFIWGLLTTFARLTSNIYFDHLFWITAHQSLFEFLIRWPHFMLPLIAILLERQTQR